ncbi:hypothetical protein DVA67_010860 [Solirubrobacter sp. CPCC 204708]|uniref:YciI family protein n=1 Tax=Solirubrobacter deserti TaxID=2282478 RepID=A0ABT4RHK6_9ACTN|nr:YciI family protein [Solirubrobacter deserti]MBE2316478.1 hypothetical protein [Solirubrobacter deserti]MDA0138011.1 YciI family protein [Solirubrobacter deserti]
MTRYALIVHQPDGPPPADLDLDGITRDVRALEQEMRDAGVWVFSGGLHDASTATTVQVRDGELITTDGPYPEGHEHIGGLTVIEVDDLDAALKWGRKSAQVINGLPIEVRPFYG